MLDSITSRLKRASTQLLAMGVFLHAMFGDTELNLNMQYFAIYSNSVRADGAEITFVIILPSLTFPGGCGRAVYIRTLC